jgi:YbgC/YbaW family acyl-CoA thioester hydrolase
MKQTTMTRTIKWGDLDALGIVFYPRYYEWIDAAGHAFFDSLGLNLWRLWTERGLQFGLVETRCLYLKPGRYQDRIEIVTSIQALKEKTLVLSHKILRAGDQTLLAEGFEKRICLDTSDPKRLKARSIPEDIYAVLSAAAIP